MKRNRKCSVMDYMTKKMYLVHTNGTKVEIVKGYPQYDKVAAGKATITDGIVLDRKTNFDCFDENLARQWRSNTDLIPEDFKQFFKNENINIKRLQADDITLARNGKTGLGYTWHESEDMHTGYLVKTELHKSLAHSGGIEQLKYNISHNNMKLLEKTKMYKMLLKI